MPHQLPHRDNSQRRTKEENEVKKLGNICIDCGSNSINRVEEREGRVFRFERIEYACGATLETYHTANDNMARAIHSGCSAGE